VQPGAGDDPDGVRVAVPAGYGLVVEVRGTGVRMAGVRGEVADRVAQLLVGLDPLIRVSLGPKLMMVC
jgi:hypothetical protein